MKCQATLKKGSPCTYKAKSGSNYCGLHEKCKGITIKLGQNVKNRAGSSRNGFATSVSNNSEIIITEEQINERNKTLEIDHTICLYCDKKANTIDHFIPSCNTTESIYGCNNKLNCFPSCSKCNNSKGGKVNQKLKEWLPTRSPKWNPEKIDILINWCDNNKKYLYLSNEDIEYIQKNKEIIDKTHETWEECAKTKKSLNLETMHKLWLLSSEEDKIKFKERIND